MLSMVSDLLWVVAAGQLFYRLLWSLGGAGALHMDLCRAFSLQTLFSYAFIYAMKVVNLRFWRWHELPDAGWSADRAVLLALGGACAIVATCQCSVSEAADADTVRGTATWLKNEALGHEALEYVGALYGQAPGGWA